MKTRESGMPPEELWRSFFDPAAILTRLGLTAGCQCVVDLGCGFGTFSIPAAQIAGGTVHAIDIDAEMVTETRRKAGDLGLRNLTVVERDFVEAGSGLADGSVDFAMLFNILHAAEAPLLLNEARRILKKRGVLAVIHWNYDSATPRGPSMEIRLRPDDCRRLVELAGFHPGPLLDLPPHHYGFTAD